MKVGDSIEGTGFEVSAVILGRITTVGAAPSDWYVARRHLPSGKTVEHMASSPEVLTNKCRSWLNDQMSRKDGGALAHKKTVVATFGPGAENPKPPVRDPDSSVAA